MTEEKARPKVNRPKSRTDRLALRLPPGFKRDAEAAAAAENRTLTNWVENLIAEALAKRRDS